MRCHVVDALVADIDDAAVAQAFEMFLPDLSIGLILLRPAMVRRTRALVQQAAVQASESIRRPTDHASGPHDAAKGDEHDEPEIDTI